MRYLLLSVRVVSLVGVLVIPDVFAATYTHYGVVKEQINTEMGIFYVNEVKKVMLTNTAQKIIIDVTYKNTQNEIDKFFFSDIGIKDNLGTTHSYTKIQSVTCIKCGVLPGDIISGKLEYVIGSDLLPKTAIIDHFLDSPIVVDLTTVASPPDQRPKTEMKSLGKNVFTNENFELTISNEFLGGSGVDPAIYSAVIKITNIGGKTFSIFPTHQLYVKDPDGFLYKASKWSGNQYGDLYPGESFSGAAKFELTKRVPDQIMLIAASFGGGTIYAGLRPEVANELSPTPTPALERKWGTVSIDNSKFELGPRETLQVKVFGTVEDPISSNWVYMTVAEPNGNTYQIKTVKTSVGYYENYIDIDYENLGYYNVKVSFGNKNIGTINFEAVEKSKAITKSPAIVIATAKTSYKAGDTIFIAGSVKNPIPNQSVKLFITAPNGDHIWFDELTLPSSGKFSTSASTSSPLWEQSGTYTITASYSTDAFDSKTFSFTIPQAIADFETLPTPTVTQTTETSSEVALAEAAEAQAAAEQQIAELEAELEAERGGGCLIATAAFGSEMAPQVQQLRELRDNTVLQTQSGTSFMAGFNQFYYSFSPAIADYERENPAFKEAVKLTLTPLLASLTLLQYADIDSESEMLGYGISIILLNIGMYFVAPAVLIMKIRKRI